ncbi:MAG: DUF4349 domain-containing protein [Clostridiales bacterium]|nr:DUF4349 domain-containing protein [Clostridiales bacterium]
MTMNCERFRSMLDRYIDSELSEEERSAMEEHTLSCDDCAELLNQALTTATMCAELNEGLTVPLECQAGWRRAVREEAAQAKKTPKWLVWRRALSVAAAAVALFFAVGGALNPNGLTLKAALMNSADQYNETAGYESSYMSDAAGMARTANGKAAFLLESDGALDTGKAVGASGESAQSGEIVVLRSALRHVVSKSFDSDLMWLEDLLREYNAYFEERTITGQAEEYSRVLDASIRVPSASLDDFLTALDDMGTVTLREERAEDITADYTDVSTRLAVLRSQLDQLNAMNETAESVSDLIAIHERATELMAEIESYESTLRGWSSQQNYSTVSLTVEEDVTGGEDAPSASLGERMKEAFNASVEWLRTFGQNAAIFLAALAPRLAVWGPVAVIVIVIICLVFRRKKK